MFACFNVWKSTLLVSDCPLLQHLYSASVWTLCFSALVTSRSRLLLLQSQPCWGAWLKGVADGGDCVLVTSQPYSFHGGSFKGTDPSHCLCAFHHGLSILILLHSMYILHMYSTFIDLHFNLKRNVHFNPNNMGPLRYLQEIDRAIITLLLLDECIYIPCAI